MRGAAPALCWLLEQRPTLMAQLALGPELLLDAIRVTACRAPTAARDGAVATAGHDLIFEEGSCGGVLTGTATAAALAPAS